MYLKKKIPREPYLQIWTPEMHAITNEVPFGKPCFICMDFLTEDDHLNARPITNNNFMKLSHFTPDQYAQNIVVCGQTYDCYLHGLLGIRDHLTHYAHRVCYEQYINHEHTSHVVCPFIRTSFPSLDGLPMKFQTANFQVYLDNTRLEKLIENTKYKNEEQGENTNLISLNKTWTNNNNILLKNLPTPEKDALYAYTRWFYIPINNGLRSHHITEIAFDATQRIINVLNCAIPYPEEICFYRAVPQSYADQLLTKLVKGDVVEMYGFNSQSVSISSAASFGDHVMVLCYPAGTKLIYLPVISHHPNEHEILTYPNQDLVFVKSEKNKSSYTYYYFDVKVRPIDLDQLINEKKMYITYNYDDIYEHIHDKLDYLFQNTYTTKRDKSHVFIFSTEKAKNEDYLKKMVADTPKLIFDLEKNNMQTDNLYLATVSSDVSLFPVLQSKIKNRTALEEIVSSEIEDGLVLSFDISSLSISSDVLVFHEENKKLFDELILGFSDEILLRISENQITLKNINPSVIIPSFIVAYLQYFIKVFIKDYNTYRSNQINKIINYNDHPFYYIMDYISTIVVDDQLLEVYFELFQICLTHITTKVFNFTNYCFPNVIYDEFVRRKLSDLCSLLESMKDKNFIFSNIPDSFKNSPPIAKILLEVNIYHGTEIVLPMELQTIDHMVYMLQHMYSLNDLKEFKIIFLPYIKQEYYTNNTFLDALWKAIVLLIRDTKYKFNFTELELPNLVYEYGMAHHASILIDVLKDDKTRYHYYENIPTPLQTETVVSTLVDINMYYLSQFPFYIHKKLQQYIDKINVVENSDEKIRIANTLVVGGYSNFTDLKKIIETSKSTDPKIVHLYFDILEYMLCNTTNESFNFNYCAIPMYILSEIAKQKMDDFLVLLRSIVPKKIYFTPLLPEFENKRYKSVLLDITYKNVYSMKNTKNIWKIEHALQALADFQHEPIDLEYFRQIIIKHMEPSFYESAPILDALWSYVVRVISGKFNLDFNSLQLDPVVYECGMKRNPLDVTIFNFSIYYRNLPKAIKTDEIMAKLISFNAEYIVQFKNDMEWKTSSAYVLSQINRHLQNSSIGFNTACSVLREVKDKIAPFCDTPNVLDELKDCIFIVFYHFQYIHVITIENQIPENLLKCYIQHRKKEFINLLQSLYEKDIRYKIHGYLLMIRDKKIVHALSMLQGI